MRLRHDRLRDVADAIDERPAGYDQKSWCGSASCVAAWAATLHRVSVIEDGEREAPPDLADIAEVAQWWLQRTDDGRDRLFAAVWPVDWWRRARIDVPENAAVQDDGRLAAQPGAADATAILRAMTDERM